MLHSSAAKTTIALELTPHHRRGIRAVGSTGTKLHLLCAQVRANGDDEHWEQKRIGRRSREKERWAGRSMCDLGPAIREGGGAGLDS